MATVDPLAEQIRTSVSQLTRRAVRLYRLRALLWAVGLALVATVGFIGLDYALHVEERGWRWLLSSLWLATLLQIIRRYYPDATSFRLTPVQVAQWIERRRPELGDSLSRLLSVGQLPEYDDRFGSVEFRREALRSYDAQLSQLPWHSFLEKKPAISAALFCAVSVLLVSLSAVLTGAVATRGLARITTPWSWKPWPRAEQLELIGVPDLIARDSELEVRVVDVNPPFPELVELEVRGGNLENTNDTEPLRLPMRQTQDMAVVTLPAMQTDFAIRPIGGDQTDGPWHSIKVTRQPQLKEYAFAIEPPGYTHEAATELVGQRIDVISGSRVTFRGSYDEPIQSLRAIAISDNKAKSSAAADTADGPLTWTARLSPDGKSFELFASGDDSAVVTVDRRWQFELETSDGLRVIDNKQWMIHVTTDRPPAVTMAPILPRIVTRSATLDIRGSASDDLGLADVQLSWHVTNQASQSMPLWPTAPSTKESGQKGEPKVDQKNDSTVRNLDLAHAWPVGTAALSVGQTLTVELVARDSAGQVGKSVPQTLEVLDDAAALAALQRQQTEMFGPLRQLFDAQRRNQQSLNRTLEMARQSESVDREQADALANSQQLGQSIAGGLARNPDSLARQLEQLGEQLDRNQLGETGLAKDVAQLQSQLEELVQHQLSPALKEMEQAGQSLRGNANHAAAVKQLEQATQANQKATDRLAAMVDNVSVAESLADLQKEIQELAGDQAAVAADTQRLQVDAVVRGNSSKATAQRAGIQSDQQNLARRLEELASRMADDTRPSSKETAPPTSTDTAQLSSTDTAQPSTTDSAQPSSSKSLRDAASQQLVANAHRRLLERRIDEQMRQAIDALKENELGPALAAQQRAQQLLGEVASELGGNKAQGLESTSESMQSLADALDRLASQGRRSADELQRAASAAPDANAKREMANQQQQLREDIEKLAEQSEAQANEKLRELLQSAAQSAEQAFSQAEQSEFEEASDRARDASSQLEAAAQTAKQKADQLKNQVAQQQMLDLRALLSNAVKQQLPIVARLSQLTAQPPTDNAAVSGELLKSEQQVQLLLADGRQRFQSLDAFDWLLSQCDDELMRTIASLERQRLGADVLASAQAALDMLRAAQTAVTEASQPDADTAQPSEPNAQTTPEDSATAKLPALASLKLLRQMQTLINQQSEKLLSAPDASSDTASDAALARMADRQQALAEQVQRLREQLNK